MKSRPSLWLDERTFGSSYESWFDYPNYGQIGVLPNHAPIATAVDIGILIIRLNDQWLTIALMGGFAIIGNNEITFLVNDAEKGNDIDPQEAQQTLEIA